MNAGGFSGSGSAAAFAVQLGAAGPYVGRRPAEVVLPGGGRVLTYAPATPQQFEFKWGPARHCADGLQANRDTAGSLAAPQSGEVLAYPSTAFTQSWNIQRAATTAIALRSVRLYRGGGCEIRLARGCPQHAFQHCWPAFTNGRHRA